MKLTNTFVVPILLALAFILVGVASGFPASAPEAVSKHRRTVGAMENMRQIPQWHCLRYRKFDLVRRCRNYRIARKH